MSKVLVIGGAGYIGAHICQSLVDNGYSVRIFDDFSNGLHRRINGITDFFLTKLDVLTGWEKIPVCVAYEIDGQRVEELPASQTDFHHAKPIYEYLPGWSEDISKARKITDLPANARSYVKFLEEVSGASMSAIGVGPGRDETIVVKDLI